VKRFLFNFSIKSHNQQSELSKNTQHIKIYFSTREKNCVFHEVIHKLPLKPYFTLDIIKTLNSQKKENPKKATFDELNHNFHHKIIHFTYQQMLIRQSHKPFRSSSFYPQPNPPACLSSVTVNQIMCQSSHFK